MKKLLGIIFIYFFLNSNLYASQLELKCTVKYVDDKDPMYKVGEDIYLVYDLNSGIIVQEGFIKDYYLTKIIDSYWLAYTEIHRLSGEKIDKYAEVNENDYNEFKNFDYKKKDLDTYNKIFYKVNKTFLLNKLSKLDYWDKPHWSEVKSMCEKAEKKF